MLKTDAQGRIELGALADIVAGHRHRSGRTAHTWPLRRDQHTYSADCCTAETGEPLEVPVPGPGAGAAARRSVAAGTARR